MARVKHPKIPLPPRDGLGASRVRNPGPGPIAAFDLIASVVKSQRHRHPDDDDAAVLRRFEQGQVVLIDATPLAPTTPIPAGTDVFFYRVPAPETPVPYEITTVYEDENILVVNKPPFLATMPRAAHITETATVRLRRATGNEELTPAHRLDRMTAGLLLLTKRREVRGAYQELFAAKKVRKRYEAVAPASVLETPLTWESHIQKRHGDIASVEVPGVPANAVTVVRSVRALPASTEAKLREIHGTEGDLASYVLEPVTGKTHQLRLHMCSAGIPILGDPVYPDVLPYEDEDFARPLRLTSGGLDFVDPLSGKERSFTTPAWLP